MVKLTTEGLKTTAGVLLVDISGTANFTRKVVVTGMQSDDALGNYAYHPTFVKEGVGGVYEQYVNRQLTYNPKTNTLTTGTISATSSASTVDISNSSSELTYPVFIDNSSLGSSRLCAKPGSLKYHQTSNTLYANIDGIAENAKKVYCENKNGVSGDFYVNFINGSSTNYYSHFQDQSLKYNPSTGTLTATKFSGAMSGTVTGTATSANNADNASNTTISSTTSTGYPILVSNNNTGSQSHGINSNFSFSSSTNTLTSPKFNASGADFAEYMKKKNGTFMINCGDICGIDQNGLLTNVFAESFHFCVKSTSPAIIAKGNKEQDELTEAIAFCGQVPVNVFQCSVGDYIVPTETTSGLITGKNISSSSISFDQYKLSVGKVIRINADGTAEIIVKI